MSYFLKPSLNENDLAIIERGDTAIHSIEAGQYVSWKGRTGKAKAAILQGTTLDGTLFDYDEDGAINELNAFFTSKFHVQRMQLQNNQSYSFDYSGPIWFCLHGYTDTGGCLCGGDTRGKLYNMIGSTPCTFSYSNGKITVTNKIGWGETFYFFG